MFARRCFHERNEATRPTRVAARRRLRLQRECLSTVARYPHHRATIVVVVGRRVKRWGELPRTRARDRRSTARIVQKENVSSILLYLFLFTFFIYVYVCVCVFYYMDYHFIYTSYSLPYPSFFLLISLVSYCYYKLFYILIIIIYSLKKIFPKILISLLPFIYRHP